ncbi:MAG: hypothetical protein NTZ69_04075 [Bacteroidia bacterium]|nr:hypothetical protein [Bacteroidia bacterium]
MNTDILNQTISEVSLNAILSVVALIVTFGGVVLSILFFSWARKEQKEANQIYNRVFNESNNLINIINEKINFLGQSEAKTRETLIKYLTDSNTQLLTERIKEKMDKEMFQSSISDNGTEASEKFKSIINETFIEDVSKENLKQIQDTNIVLSQLNKVELSVLYSIWSLQNRKAPTTNEKIISESGLINSEIELALKSLKNRRLLNDMSLINSKYLKVLNNLFVIDEYTGMRFAEKINALKELIQRIPKVI